MKLKTALASSALALGLALTAPTAAAFANSELSSCLLQSPICIENGASINNASELRKKLDGKVKVAVLSNNGSYTDLASTAESLAHEAKLSELIVVLDKSGNDSFAVYSATRPADELAMQLNTLGEEDGGDALMEADLKSFYEQPKNDKGSSAPFIMLATGVTVIGTVALVARSRKLRKSGSTPTQAKTKASAQSANTIDNKTAGAILNSFNEEVKHELAKLLKTHDSYAQSPYQELQTASLLLTQLLQRLYELSTRIKKKKSSQSLELAEVRYLDILRKLNKALSEDYFEDLVKKPQFWSDSEAKTNAVLRALEAVSEQLLENIKQVNSSKDLEFQIALSSLNPDATVGDIDSIFKSRDQR